jgi:hypothetical protein
VLVQGGLKYHEFWLDWLKRVDEREWKRGDGEKGWDDYRRHHCLNTPGRPFLTAQFGAEWTEEFLAKQMYGPAAMVGLPEDLAAAS